jgi:hypothetical protein
VNYALGLTEPTPLAERRKTFAIFKHEQVSEIASAAGAVGELSTVVGS